jgi:hypothetical protein
MPPLAGNITEGSFVAGGFPFVSSDLAISYICTTDGVRTWEIEKFLVGSVFNIVVVSFHDSFQVYIRHYTTGK